MYFYIALTVSLNYEMTKVAILVIMEDVFLLYKFRQTQKDQNLQSQSLL